MSEQIRTSEQTLAAALQELREQARASVPADFLERFARERDDFVAQTRDNPALTVGDSLPDVDAQDADGRTVALRDYHRDGPLILSFFRGSWCKFCNLELRALQNALPHLRRLGATLVGISPQMPDFSRELSAQSHLDFPVLTDRHNEVARRFGLVFRAAHGAAPPDLARYNGDDSHTLPVPATFVVDRGGFVRYAFVEFDFTYRAEPAEIIRAVRACTARAAS